MSPISAAVPEHLGAHLSELAAGFDIALDVFDAPMAAPDYLRWWQEWAGWPSAPSSADIRSGSDQARP
ncbi:hypothetical protein AB0F85_32220 [Nocardia fluminea]|uniref:hypothetical protein n=1 Tax=Nocardia fluminea TaxID=134984 RepID=UPI0033D361D0